MSYWQRMSSTTGRVLAHNYGLAGGDLGTFINYDVKYRMGRDGYPTVDEGVAWIS